MNALQKLLQGFLWLTYTVCLLLLPFSAFFLYDHPVPLYLTGYTPTITSYLPIISILYGHAALLAAAASVLLALPRRLGIFLVWVGVVLQIAVITCEFIHFTKFDSFFHRKQLEDFLDAPWVFLDYTASGIQSIDEAVLFAVTVCTSLLAIVPIRRLQGQRSILLSVVLYVVLGTSLIFSGRSLFEQVPTPENFVAREKFHPVYRWYLSSAESLPENEIDLITPFLPISTVDSTRRPSPRLIVEHPQHIVLILAEALRADHFALYGYKRDTTPYLQKQARDWIRFKRAYAQGPSTSTSFPALLKSRYLAGISRRELDQPSIFQNLKSSNRKTAFISAGAMDWNNLVATLGLDAADYLFYANEASRMKVKKVWENQHTYAMHDEVVIQQYRAFLKQFGHTNSTFAVLHLIGSHYPYFVDEPFQQYTPTLTDTEGSFNERLINSYDNAIRHIDFYTHEIVRSLSDIGDLDRSLVILTADHGEGLGTRGVIYHSTSYHDEQVRVPLLLRTGVNLPTLAETLRAHAERTVGLIDLIPTVLELSERSKYKSVQGRSLLAPKAKPYEVLVFREYGQQAAILRGNKKYIFDFSTMRPFEYDLRADPGELQNLWNVPTKTFADFLRHLETIGAIAKTSSAQTSSKSPL